MENKKLYSTSVYLRYRWKDNADKLYSTRIVVIVAATTIEEVTAKAEEYARNTFGDDKMELAKVDIMPPIPFNWDVQLMVLHDKGIVAL